MTATDTLRAAASQIGYYAPADPEPGSKFGRWAADQLGQSWLRGPSTSIWWCMLFASWAVYQSGGTLPGGIQFNTDTATNKARAEGRLVSKADAQPGDLAIFDWNMSTAATDHVGIIEQNRGSVYQTIEGNTSAGTAGSQSAGNGVHRRVRATSLVRYVIRPYYTGGSTPPPAPAGDGKIDEDGSWGKATTGLAQTVLGTPRDGIVSGQPPANRAVMLTGAWDGSGWEWVVPAGGSALIARMEEIMKSAGQYTGKIDGIAGPGFARGLCLRYNGSADNKLDRISRAVQGMQRALNAGRF